MSKGGVKSEAGRDQGPDPEHLACHEKYRFYTKYDGMPQEGNK